MSGKLASLPRNLRRPLNSTLRRFSGSPSRFNRDRASGLSIHRTLLWSWSRLPEGKDRFRTIWLCLLLLVLTCGLPLRAAQTNPSKPDKTSEHFNPAVTGDRLQFLDGSSLHGRLRNLSTDHGV